MSDPTMAEVADKAVDHIANGVQQIAATVEKLAPGAWQMAVRAQFVTGIVDTVLGAAIIVAMAFGMRFVYRACAGLDDFDRTRAGVFSAAGFLIVFFFSAWFIHDGVIKMAAPEYCAARELISAAHK